MPYLKTFVADKLEHAQHQRCEILLKLALSVGEHRVYPVTVLKVSEWQAVKFQGVEVLHILLVDKIDQSIMANHSYPCRIGC